MAGRTSRKCKYNEVEMKNLHFEDIAGGFPCTNYLLRSMVKHDHYELFQKIFFSVLSRLNLTDSQIREWFSTVSLNMPFDSPLREIALLDAAKNDADFISSMLWSQSNLKNESCESFYSNFDKKKRCCSLCPVSLRYKCKYLKEEMLLTRYAAEKEENYKRLVDEGFDRKTLVSLVDLQTMYVESKVPFNVVLYKEMFHVLSLASFRKGFYQADLDQRTDIMSEALAKNILKDFNYHLKPSIASYCESCFQAELVSDGKAVDILRLLAPKSPSDIIQASQVPSNSKDILSSFLAGAPVPASLDDSNTEVNARSVSDDKPAADQTKVVDVNTSSDMLELHNVLESYVSENENKRDPAESGHPDIPGVDNDVSTSSKSSEDFDIEAPDIDDIPAEAFEAYIAGEDTGNIDMTCENKSVSDDVSDVSKVTDSASKEDCPAAGSENNRKSERHKASGKKSVERPETGVSTTVFEVIDKDAPVGYTIDVESHSLGEMPPAMDMHGDLVYNPFVKKNELVSCARPLHIPNMANRISFESYVTSEKMFCAECVACEDGKEYLLLWVASRHSFFYADMDNVNARELLLPLFSMKSIDVICYSPYAIYAYIRRYGGQVRSLHSIQTFHYMINRDDPDYLSVVRFYGVRPAVPGVTFKFSGTLSSHVFFYMPYYKIIKIKQERLLPDNLSGLLQSAEQVNEAVGFSYRLDSVTASGGILFAMPNPLEFKFNMVSPADVVPDGCMVTYHSELKFPVFRDVVCDLVRRGFFNGKELMLLLLGISCCVFYVPAVDTSFFMTTFQRIFTCICKNYGLRRVPLDVKCVQGGCDVALLEKESTPA